MLIRTEDDAIGVGTGRYRMITHTEKPPLPCCPEEPRFVLLEHDWNGVHWDFMLEDGEVLRTWAIDHPVVSGRMLSARVLPDHRRVYLEYEGPISGNRGRVRRVDEGAYRVLEWSPDVVRVELAGGQLVGEVELRASTSPSGAPTSWTFSLRNFD